MVCSMSRGDKAQAFADFIVECTNRPMASDDTKPWELYVDGSATKKGSGAGLLIKTDLGLSML